MRFVVRILVLLVYHRPFTKARKAQRSEEIKNVRIHGFISSAKMSANSEVVELKRQLKSIEHYYNL